MQEAGQTVLTECDRLGQSRQPYPISKECCTQNTTHFFESISTAANGTAEVMPIALLIILWFGGALYLRWIRVKAVEDPSWGEWVILPLYVFVTAVRVLGLAFIVVATCFSKHCDLFTAKNTAAMLRSSCDDFNLFAYFAFQMGGNGMFFFVDAFVIVSLSSHGCGTRVLRAGTRLVLALVTMWLILGWGESVNSITFGSLAQEIRQECHERFGVDSLETKLFGASWGPSFLSDDAPSTMQGALPYWIAIIVFPLVYLISYAGIGLAWWHPPRQALLTPLYGLMSWLNFMIASFQLPIVETLGFNPTNWVILLTSIGSIVIMILDSRWWNSYSGSSATRTGGESIADNLSYWDEMETPLVKEVSGSLQSELESLGPNAVAPRIRFTSIQLEEIIAAGATATVFKGRYDDTGPRAIKRLYCEDFDPELGLMTMVEKDGTAETRGIAREIAISRCLAAESPAIVQCDGFSIQPPHVLVVMELCELGCLMDVLEKHDIQYQNRLRLAHDCASAVAHVHKLDFVHRDIKSLNFFCTQSQSSERRATNADPNPMQGNFELRCLLGNNLDKVSSL